MNAVLTNEGTVSMVFSSNKSPSRTQNRLTSQYNRLTENQCADALAAVGMAENADMGDEWLTGATDYRFKHV
jgi:hypothetical protein